MLSKRGFLPFNQDLRQLRCQPLAALLPQFLRHAVERLSDTAGDGGEGVAVTAKGHRCAESVFKTCAFQKCNNRAVLSQLFNRHRNGKWNSYDTATAISYLIQREFCHGDLINVLENRCPRLYQYYILYCNDSFINCFRATDTNTYIKVIDRDWKTYYLYFMYCIETYKHNNLSAFAFFKNYFDRITAHLAYQTKFEPDLKKPNYKNFYKHRCTRGTNKIK